MNKKMIILLIIFAAVLLSAYKTNSYMKVIDVNGRVKISSQKAIIKPAQNGDLLFTQDRITTEKNSSLISYLESNNIFKIKENSSLNINESYDRKGNTKLFLDNGTFLIAVSSNAKANSINISTPNANIIVSGAASITHTDSITKAQFLYEDAIVNGTNVNKFSEVEIDNSNKIYIKNMEYNDSLTNTVKEILDMPYIEYMIPDPSYIDIDNFLDNNNTLDNDANNNDIKNTEIENTENIENIKLEDVEIEDAEIANVEIIVIEDVENIETNNIIFKTNENIFIITNDSKK